MLFLYMLEWSEIMQFLLYALTERDTCFILIHYVVFYWVILMSYVLLFNTSFPLFSLFLSTQSFTLIHSVFTLFTLICSTVNNRVSCIPCFNTIPSTRVPPKRHTVNHIFFLENVILLSVSLCVYNLPEWCCADIMNALDPEFHSWQSWPLPITAWYNSASPQPH